MLDDETDVSHLSDRELLLRAVNSTLATEQNVGHVLRELSEVRGDIADIRRRLAPGGEIEHRARAVSSHEFESAADAIAGKLLAEFRGPRGGTNNLTRETVVEVVTATLGAERLRSFEEAAKDAKKLRTQIKAGAVVALITIAATAVAAHFEGRATAPQTQVHP